MSSMAAGLVLIEFIPRLKLTKRIFSFNFRNYFHSTHFVDEHCCWHAMRELFNQILINWKHNKTNLNANVSNGRSITQSHLQQ